jgi:hypothetical protein
MLEAVATIGTLTGAEVVETNDIGVYAVELAINGWRVFPLRGKAPAIPRPHGRGVYDATTDLDQIIGWWSGRYAGANIGTRIPEPLVVLDIDPRHHGDDTIAQLEAAHGPLPPTLTTLTGGDDGGRHLYFLRPTGELTVRDLPGIDLKTSKGYTVSPPSLHPVSGRRYRWETREPAAMPSWLRDVLTPARPVRVSPAPIPDRARTRAGSIADDYSASTSWSDLLPRHGWTLVGGDGDSDGSSWRHSAATAAVSATVRHRCLFVYSPNTPLPVTEAGDPRGITRFRAYAVLDHNGDLSAAARTLAAEVIR